MIPAHGQSPSEYPRTPWGGYPYPASSDAEIADPDVHRVLFENEHVMFLEVAKTRRNSTSKCTGILTHRYSRVILVREHPESWDRLGAPGSPSTIRTSNPTARMVG